MPIVLRLKGYRFGFYASDADEPPHVHVKMNGKHAKFWLRPTVELEFNRRYRPQELNEIRRMINDNRSKLLEAWREFFGV
ncbi:MAG TPA: DUF4160 domain-containing protein [Tepidisphaeraceae bacterium]|jgi:hypothetical protein|nr:DUF4160 domain-containing protein [Tepidisphaeraceae bacterium]